MDSVPTVPFWTPDAWDDFTSVGIMLFLLAFLGVAYMRGWLIPGRHHREIVEARDREIAARDRVIEKADERSGKDAETMAIQARTIAENKARDEATAHLIQSVREIAEKPR